MRISDWSSDVCSSDLIATGPSNSDSLDCVKSLRTVEVPGYRISEAIYLAAGVVPAQQHERAILCLAIEGGYWMEWGRTRLDCGSASLVLQPPGHVFGAHISHEIGRAHV